ncbi:hypothetical protein CHUAL_002694 [Chamberlinius hualienensis]
MDRQNHGMFGSYIPSYTSSDPSLNVPVIGGGNLSSLSPYLNVDPSFLNGPEFIFPEGASRHRGRFELAFSQIGGSVITGGILGGANGIYRGLIETSAAGFTGGVKRTQMLNIITKQGASSANLLAVMYSAFGCALSALRGTDDELNTLTAATATGLLFKSTAGWKRSAIGGAVGLSLASIYCFWTSKDRITSMLQSRY